MIFFEKEKEKNEINFTKMHGLGNDYLVINCINDKNIIEETDISRIARYLCNRNFGVGADGIILVNKSKMADFRMSIYNSDGSEAQMCGNGIRCFAKYVYDNNLIENQEINIETLAGIKSAYIRKARMNNEISEITVDMGKAIFEKEQIPVLIEENEDISEETIGEERANTENVLAKVKLNILKKELEAYCVSIGNPHAIIFCENVEEIPIKEFGSIIEKDEHFPEKTNVEFIQVLGSSSIKMRVWERGVGETYACGTGACAVAVVCNKLKLTKSNLTVYLKGGELRIEIDNSTQKVYMTGIATTVFDGKVKV